MVRYLNHLDLLKEKYIITQNSVGSANYPFTQFYYYQNIEYIADNAISFSQTLRAVKLVNTAILLIDPETQTKVYFTDDDITSIIATIMDEGLKNHIINGLKNAIAKKGLDTISFNLDAKTFKIKGISFKEAFNDIFCKNPAGEIGVFGSNKELRDRIITLVPEKFSVEEEKLSNFLRLAFWNSHEKLINNQVIRFYPTTKRTMVSDTHSFYETFFSKNKLPRAIGAKIDSQLNKYPKSSVVVLGSKINRLEKGALLLHFM